MKTHLHETYFGLGDCIYERPFVVEMAKQFDRVYVRTPFPQLYWDQDPGKFLFLPRRTRLNLQAQSIDQFKNWQIEPEPAQISHQSCFWMSGVNSPISSQTARFLRDSGLPSVAFSMPVNREWKNAAFRFFEEKLLDLMIGPLRRHKFCIIKRPTVRTEWYCPARNPKIEYLQAIINYLRETHIIVSVAALREGEEWLDGDLYGIDLELHSGEIDVWTLLGLVKIADLSVCTQSFVVPWAMATRSKCFCVYGGFGGPWRFTSPWIRTAPHFGYAAPDPFCDCGKMEHDCKKDIPNFMKTFQDYHDGISDS